MQMNKYMGDILRLQKQVYKKSQDVETKKNKVR